MEKTFKSYKICVILFVVFVYITFFAAFADVFLATTKGHVVFNYDEQWKMYLYFAPTICCVIFLITSSGGIAFNSTDGWKIVVDKAHNLAFYKFSIISAGLSVICAIISVIFIHKYLSLLTIVPFILSILIYKKAKILTNPNKINSIFTPSN